MKSDFSVDLSLDNVYGGRHTVVVIRGRPGRLGRQLLPHGNAEFSLDVGALRQGRTSVKTVKIGKIETRKTIMKNFWLALTSAIRSFFHDTARTPRRVKGRRARIEPLENRLALSASMPTSTLAIIREAIYASAAPALVAQYLASSQALAQSIDLCAFAETVILDEDAPRFEEEHDATTNDSDREINLSVTTDEYASTAYESDATKDYEELVAQAREMVIENVSETQLSEIDFQGELDDEIEYYFDRFGVYINGERCIALDDVAKLPQSFRTRRADANRAISVASRTMDEANGLRSGGGDSGGSDPEIESVDIELDVEYVRRYGSNAVLTLNPNAISEGYDPYDEDKTVQGYLAGDYMKVGLPPIPVGYEARVTFKGTATRGQDYVVFTSYPPTLDLNPLYGNLDHSGGAAFVYVFPTEDCEAESDETATLRIGTPQLQASGGTDTHAFNMLVDTATTTIIDNDQWKIVVTPEAPYTNADEIIIAEGTTTESAPSNTATFRVSRVENLLFRGGDDHYPIEVRLTFPRLGPEAGTAKREDFKILAIDENGNMTQRTPEEFTNLIRVTIPAQSDSTFISIEAEDDDLVERLYENIKFYVCGAYNHNDNSLRYAYEDVGALEVKIEDDDKLVLEKLQFDNNGNL